MMYLLAFLGGVLMNLMPCVLPVLPLKLRALAEPKKKWAHVAGIMSSFMVVATLSLLLGTGLSQMPQPVFRAAVVMVCMTMGAHLLGFWQMPSFGYSGNIGAFGSGALTVALGTSCAVPFLAPVLVYASTGLWYETYLLFGAIGGGFCSPLLFLSSDWIRFRGDWSLFFERACGWGMLVVSVWLGITFDMETAFLIYLFGICGVGSLILNRNNIPRTVVDYSLLFVSCLLLIGINEKEPDVSVPTVGPRVVFVTADWCTTCYLVKPMFEDPDVLNHIQQNGINKPTIIDWTDTSDVIRDYLKENGTQDVPFCLVQNDDGIVTKFYSLWTKKQLIDSLN